MSNKTASLLLIAVSNIFVLIALLIAGKVNTIVANPYMDEIFHIPQAQRMVCNFSMEWDSKITTPPGLYFLSGPISWTVKLFNNELACSPILFRR